ncbi:MAG: hypothetical protein JKY46_01115 [Robiginitomaculum sp.]|nr:hypothetical protein [Robiginitomaculum sp.]
MLSSLFNFREKSTPVTTNLPRLELSGPVLAESYQAMVHGCEALGGVERYVAALKLKHELFARQQVEMLCRGLPKKPLPDYVLSWVRCGGELRHTCTARNLSP